MKKIALFFLTFAFSTNVFATTSNITPLKLNTPVHWYVDALDSAIFATKCNNDQNTNNKEQARIATDNFMKTLDIYNGVTFISPADFLDKCMSVCKDHDAATKCSNALIEAVTHHNTLVRTYTPIPNLPNTDIKVEWTIPVLYAAWTQLADPASDLLGGDEKFREYLNSVNYTASLNDLLTECNKSWERLSASNDPFIEFEYSSLKSKDFTCQKFIETLVKEYNKNKDEHHLEGYIRL